MSVTLVICISQKQQDIQFIIFATTNNKELLSLSPAISSRFSSSSSSFSFISFNPASAARLYYLSFLHSLRRLFLRLPLLYIISLTPVLTAISPPLLLPSILTSVSVLLTPPDPLTPPCPPLPSFLTLTSTSFPSLPTLNVAPYLQLFRTPAFAPLPLFTFFFSSYSWAYSYS